MARLPFRRVAEQAGDVRLPLHGGDRAPADVVALGIKPAHPIEALRDAYGLSVAR